MNFLAVDTTNEKLVVALQKDGLRYNKVIEVGKSGHSKLLLEAIDGILKDANIIVNDLDVVSCVVGPGSFTGIRIGVSCITALSFGTSSKRVALNAFEIIAKGKKKITAGVDAGHGNLYIAHCENSKVLDFDFIESENVKKSDFKKLTFLKNEDVANTILDIVQEKIENNEYVDVLEPFYMRKSQAERELK